MIEQTHVARQRRHYRIDDGLQLPGRGKPRLIAREIDVAVDGDAVGSESRVRPPMATDAPSLNGSKRSVIATPRASC